MKKEPMTLAYARQALEAADAVYTACSEIDRLRQHETNVKLCELTYDFLCKFLDEFEPIVNKAERVLPDLKVLPEEEDSRDLALERLPEMHDSLNFLAEDFYYAIERAKTKPHKKTKR